MSAEQFRINKYLSLCGLTSRRGADELVREGRVTINGSVVENLASRVDPSCDVVKVDGAEVTMVGKALYVLLNKPREVITTLHDPFHRKTVAHLLKDLPQRVYPVGRLDSDTEGVLILTNDGELSYRLTHPRYRIEKLYEARVAGEFTTNAADRIAAGVRLEDGARGRAQVTILTTSQETSTVRLVLTEGRKREVKQLCKAVGHPVLDLRRLEFGGLGVGELQPGQWRFLTVEEVSRMKELTRL